MLASEAMSSTTSSRAHGGRQFPSQGANEGDIPTKKAPPPRLSKSQLVAVNLSLVVAAAVSVQLRGGSDGRDLVHKRMVANGVIEHCWRKPKLR